MDNLENNNSVPENNADAEISEVPVSSEAEEKTEYEPKSRYEAFLYKIYRDESLSEIFKITSYAVVAATVYALFMRVCALIGEPIEIVKLLSMLAVPFLAVSLLRAVINAPRPYELFEFYEKKPKGKCGRSFPSRHVFSVFAIGTVLLPTETLLGAGLLLLGALLAFLRVALGIHFVRDVVAGALIGLASGGIGLLVLNFI